VLAVAATALLCDSTAPDAVFIVVAGGGGGGASLRVSIQAAPTSTARATIKANTSERCILYLRR
jgi:hypothetical protein